MNLELVRSRMVSFLQKIIFPIKGSVLTIIFIFFALKPLELRVSSGTSLFTVGAGAFDIFDDETTAEFRMEYTFPEDRRLAFSRHL